MLQFLLAIILALTTNKQKNDHVPIYFREFGIEIQQVEKIGDTLFYNKSNKEDFKLVFFDTKGKCYCERYINNKIYQRGKFENSLDTLKRYVSERSIDGRNSSIVVQEYFEPLKNGDWITYSHGKESIQKYVLGVAQ